MGHSPGRRPFLSITPAPRSASITVYSFFGFAGIGGLLEVRLGVSGIAKDCKAECEQKVEDAVPGSVRFSSSFVVRHRKVERSQ